MYRERKKKKLVKWKIFSAHIQKYIQTYGWLGAFVKNVYMYMYLWSKNFLFPQHTDVHIYTWKTNNRMRFTPPVKGQTFKSFWMKNLFRLVLYRTHKHTKKNIKMFVRTHVRISMAIFCSVSKINARLVWHVRDC